MGVTRILAELVLADVVQLWASERVCLSIDYGAEFVLGSVGVGEKTGENVGSSLDEELHSVAEEVVTLQKRASVKDSPCEVGRVQTGKGVDSSGVSADAGKLWVLVRHLDCV